MLVSLPAVAHSSKACFCTLMITAIYYINQIIWLSYSYRFSSQQTYMKNPKSSCAMVLYGLPLAQFLLDSLTLTHFQHVFLSVDFAWGLYPLNPHSFTSPSLYSGNTSQGPFFDSIVHSPYMVLFFFKGLITVGIHLVSINCFFFTRIYIPWG